jgi:hypothetical protein
MNSHEYLLNIKESFNKTYLDSCILPPLPEAGIYV